MEIHGLPGSLQELLKPVGGIMKMPASINDIQVDLGRFLEGTRRMYLKHGITYNFMAEEGAKAEFFFAVEMRRLYREEGHLFNNCRISNEYEDASGGGASGMGLVSYPDHLIVTPHSFLYVESKRWKNPPEEMQKAAFRQMEHTFKNICFFLEQEEVAEEPEPFLYDDLKSFSVAGKYPIVRHPREICRNLQKAEERKNGKKTAEKIVEKNMPASYRKLVEILRMTVIA